MSQVNASQKRQRFTAKDLRIELFAGFTVAMTMIPESVSFALLAGLSPLMGMYAAFMMGIVTAIFGGRPGMVSGGAGATIIVMISLIAQYGIPYFLAAVVLAGIIQIIVGLCKWSKFISLIPQPVMYGFLNGLAIVIFLSQIKQFKSTSAPNEWMQGNALWIMIGLTILTITIIQLFPKITKKFPATLAAIILVFGIVTIFNIDTKKVSDIATVSGTLPSFAIPTIPFSWHSLHIIFPYAIIMAAVGLIESLLTMQVVDDITNTKGNTHHECMAQGSANMLNGFFGGMGGCAMIAQTLVNLDAGSRRRLSGIIASMLILLIILIGGPIIEQIPMAALVGVMIVVALTTFQWAFFRLFTKMPKPDIIIGITVATITVILYNLALAVLIGVILAALVFAWDNARRIRARKILLEDGTKVYQLMGPLFFASVSTFFTKFQVATDPAKIIIDFESSRIVDMSAIEALQKIIHRYEQAGKSIYLKNINRESMLLLRKAGGFEKYILTADWIHANK